MPAEQQIAAPAQLARIEFVSPWQSSFTTSRARRLLAVLVTAWREGMELYLRAAAARGYWEGWR